MIKTNMTHTVNQHNLIKKYKEEFLKDEKRKDIIENTKGSLSDHIKIAAGLKKKDDKMINKAIEIIKKFATETWDSNFEIRKNFKILEDWKDSLMDIFQIDNIN